MIPFQEEFWPFNTTLCLQYFKKYFKRYRRFPDIPLRLNFRISPSCRVIERSLCKSHWVESLTGWMIVIFIKNFIQSNKSLSKILPQIGSKEIDGFSCTVNHFLLWIGTTLAFFHSIGNLIWLRHNLKIIERGLHRTEGFTEGLHSLTFEYWSYHDPELFWVQDCLLSLLRSRLIFGHYLDVFSKK